MKKKRRSEIEHHKLMLEDIFLNKIKSSSVEKMIAIALLKLIRQFEELKREYDIKHSQNLEDLKNV